MPDGDSGQGRNPWVLVVEARDVAELLAARGDERGARPLVDLLERLETVGREAGAEDVDPGHARLGERDQRRLGVRLQPLRPTEAALERDDDEIVAYLEPLGDEPAGFQAFAVVGIAERQRALRQAVEAEDELVRPAVDAPVLADALG